MTNKPSIILVDDHLIFREGLRTIITDERIATIIGEASNGPEFIELLAKLNPDIAIMDIDMPLMDGVEATRKAMEIIPDLKIIAFTMFNDREDCQKMIELGVKGCLLKSCSIEELESAINEVMNGNTIYYST